MNSNRQLGVTLFWSILLIGLIIILLKGKSMYSQQPPDKG